MGCMFDLITSKDCNNTRCCSCTAFDPSTFQEEFNRAVVKYSPELWADLDQMMMIHALEREVDELKTALWKDDYQGEHGIAREAVHVQVVAQRIIDEMGRRAGNGDNGTN